MQLFFDMLLLHYDPFPGAVILEVAIIILTIIFLDQLKNKAVQEKQHESSSQLEKEQQRKQLEALVEMIKSGAVSIPTGGPPSATSAPAPGGPSPATTPPTSASHSSQSHSMAAASSTEASGSSVANTV